MKSFIFFTRKFLFVVLLLLPLLVSAFITSCVKNVSSENDEELSFHERCKITNNALEKLNTVIKSSRTNNEEGTK